MGSRLRQHRARADFDGAGLEAPPYVRRHKRMSAVRPFRFGFTGGASSKKAKLLDSARTIEALGYSTFGLADHFVRPFAPLVAGQAVTDATTTLRVTQTVLAQDFREPAVLAKELASLDVLSEGRLQVGLGAGWLRQEYETPACDSTRRRSGSSGSRRRPSSSRGCSATSRSASRATTTR